MVYTGKEIPPFDSLKVKANIGEIVWYINHFNQVAVYS